MPRSWRSAASTTGRSARESRSVAPDAVIVQDPTLLHQVDLFQGLGPDGYLLVNTSATGLEELGLGELVARLRRERVVAVPATEIAREHLGRRCRTRPCSAPSRR